MLHYFQAYNIAMVYIMQWSPLEVCYFQKELVVVAFTGHVLTFGETLGQAL